MIRWLLLVLVIVNLSVFAWGMHREWQRAEAKEEKPAGVKRLLLVGESDQAPMVSDQAGEPGSMPDSPAPGAAKPELSPPSTEVAFPRRTEPEPARAADSSPPSQAISPLAQPVPEQRTASEKVIPQASSQIAESEPSPEDEPAPSEGTGGPSAAAEETAVSSSGTEILSASASVSSPADASASEPTETLESGAEVQSLVARCFTLGPFPRRDDAETMVAGLQTDGVSAGVRQATQEEVNGYWVMIPPLPDRAAAVAMVKEIKAKGFDDVWRFTKGELNDAISLGLFARESQAQTHRRRLATRGVEADVRPRYAERAAYWVDTFPSTDPALETLLVERLGGDQEQTSEPIACPEL